jgi:hypothetical protein
MLTFCGYDLELVIDQVLSRCDGPNLCSARDAGGGQWLILQVDEAPDHLTWLCAPLTARAMQAVVERPEISVDAVRHSSTGVVELVRIENGRALRDSCILCAELSEKWLSSFGHALAA